MAKIQRKDTKTKGETDKKQIGFAILDLRKDKI